MRRISRGRCINFGKTDSIFSRYEDYGEEEGKGSRKIQSMEVTLLPGNYARTAPIA
jgi:hypothetical protein